MSRVLGLSFYVREEDPILQYQLFAFIFHCNTLCIRTSLQWLIRWERSGFYCLISTSSISGISGISLI